MSRGLDVLSPLKWAGGKRWLVRNGSLPSVPSFKRYIEPFVGGGAVFFHLAPEKAVLNDLNNELIEFYEVLRDQPCQRMKKMVEHQSRHGKRYYYNLRSQVFADRIDRAARFLYLNRTCWNGLFRVNLDGVFNVPKGTKDTVILDSDDFEQAAETLSKATLSIGDFEPVIASARKDDLLFVDPPYTVQHNMNNFIKYNEQLFSWSDQERLHKSLSAARRRGAKIILCNADHESIRNLYADFGTYKFVGRHSVLSGKSEMRRKTTEALFTANI